MLANQVVRELPPALQTDRWVYRIVVSVLGLVVLAAVIGAIMLGYHSITIPETLTALGATAVGALAGLLTPFAGPNDDQHNLNTPTNLLLGLKRKLDVPRSQRSVNSRHANLVGHDFLRPDAVIFDSENQISPSNASR
jgi:hypothetical protein